jgi:hypothetical protein
LGTPERLKLTRVVDICQRTYPDFSKFEFFNIRDSETF